MAIPFVLVSFIYKRRDVPFHWIFLMFGAFIIFCGFTHFMEVLTTQTPIYRFSGLVKVATAVVSWATVAALVPLVPKALAMRSPEELEREIAERRRLEALLQQQTQEWLRTIAAHAHCLLWYADVEDRGKPKLTWKMQLADEEAAQRFFPVSLPAGASYFQAWYESRLPEDRDRSDAYGNEQVRLGRSYTQEFRCRQADGAVRWLWEDVKIETVAPGRWRAVGVCLDVTERRRAEAERAQMQTVAEAALAHLSLEELLPELLDRIRDILFVDMAAILLRQEEELVLRAARGLDADGELRLPVESGFAPGRDPAALPAVQAADALPPLFRRNGICSLLDVPLVVDGKLLGVLQVGTRQPRQFPAEERRLLQLVGDRVALAVAHARLLEELTQENQYKDQFLAMLAHELRNPLGAISNALEVMQRGERAGAAFQRALGVVQRQVRHQVRIVDDLLDVSRINRGKISLDREWVDLAGLLRRTAEDYQPAVEAAGLSLTLSLPDDPVWVCGDPTRLAQVIGNLLANATKFTDPGGQVSVALAVEEGINTEITHWRGYPRHGEGGEIAGRGGGDRETGREINSSVHSCPHPTVSPSPSVSPCLGYPRQRVIEPVRFAAITVRDTGIGIAPEMLPHVFDSFAQADQSLDRCRGGLGLGLALVKGLIELHGGAVRAHSAGLGRGAEFTLTLPLQPLPLAPAAASDPHAPPLRRQRILLIEDNRDAAETLSDVLQLSGHHVEVAFSGPAGVEAAQRLQPDVVLCDIGLPGMDGFAVARALCRLPATAAARLVALSGYGQEDDRQQALEAGFEQHLTKPVNFAALLELLDTPP